MARHHTLLSNLRHSRPKTYLIATSYFLINLNLAEDEIVSIQDLLDKIKERLDDIAGSQDRAVERVFKEIKSDEEINKKRIRLKVLNTQINLKKGIVFFNIFEREIFRKSILKKDD